MAISSTRFCLTELVLLGILAPAGPAQTRIAPANVQAAVVSAYRSGQKRITIPPGAYRIHPPPDGPHLVFEDLSDFTIDASGAELIFTDQTRAGIEFRHCRNVALLGARIRYEVPPFTQGVVTAVSPIGSWYDVKIDAGYPVNFDDPRYFPAAPVGYIFDPRTRAIRGGTFDLNEKSVERRGAGVFRIHRPLRHQQHVAPGDLVCFRGSGPHNVSVLDSERVRLDGVTIYNAPNFAVLESGGEGGNSYRVTVTPGPPPQGASAAPLFSSTADAFHSVNVRRGPVLEGCRLEGMADDAIAIHGTYSLVMQANGNRLVVSGGALRAGDSIYLLDREDRPAGNAVIEDVQPLPQFRSPMKSHRDTRSDNTLGPYFAILLSRPLPAQFDFLMSDPQASGSGYIVRGNTIRNHRARGLLLKAENGLVEGNTIDGSTMGGIVLTPEVWWNESGFSRNVIVRNNVIRNVARAPAQLGGVVVAAIDGAPFAGCGHESIRIEGNRFENIQGVNLLITSACGVSVSNNSFIGAQHAPAQAGGAAWGEDPHSVVFVTESRDVQFRGNVASNLGAFAKTLIRTTPSLPRW